MGGAVAPPTGFGSAHGGELPQSPEVSHFAAVWCRGVGCGDAVGVAEWIRDLQHAGFAPAAVHGLVNLLPMIFADAVNEQLIPCTPVRRRRRRGRRARAVTAERVWAMPEDVVPSPIRQAFWVVRSRGCWRSLLSGRAAGGVSWRVCVARMSMGNAVCW